MPLDVSQKERGVKIKIKKSHVARRKGALIQLSR